jgi:hypothetical protein
MSVDEVLRQVKLWDEQLRKQRDSSDGTKKAIVKYGVYTWFQLLDEPALKYEGSKMGHCVGGYWHKVSKGNTHIYSLRDKKNIPHATVEYDANRNTIIQVRGKANNKLLPEYEKLFLKFANTYLKLKESNLEDSGFVFLTIKGKLQICSLYHLPNNITLDSLEIEEYDYDTLKDTPKLVLPHNLIIKGNLNLEYCNISELPKKLVVNGDLVINNCNITEFPDDIIIKGSIRIKGCKFTFPNNYTTNSFLIISDDVMLSNNLTVNGTLKCIAWNGTKIPDNLTVNGDAYFEVSKVKEIGKNVKITGKCDLTEAPLTVIPKDFKCGELVLTDSAVKSILTTNCEDFILSGTKITKLPDNLECDALDLYATKVSKLPKNGTVTEIAIGKTPIVEIPPDFKFKRLHCNDGKLKKLPDGISCTSITLINVPLNIIPKQLTTETLKLMGTDITEIPSDLKVGDLEITRTKRVNFPKKLNIQNLNLKDINNLILPATLKSKTIKITDCKIMQFPTTLKCNILRLYDSVLDSLPDNLKCNTLELEGTKIPTFKSSGREVKLL